MAIPTRRIRLRPGDRARLEAWVRTRTTPQRQVERAQIVLGSADGRSSYELAEELNISRPTVQRWLDRYEADGIEGLEDRPRSGRPRKVTQEVEEEVVEKTTQEDPPQGTHWSTRIMAEETGLHHSQVARIWKGHGLKPHLVADHLLARRHGISPRAFTPQLQGGRETPDSRLLVRFDPGYPILCECSESMSLPSQP